MDVFKTKTATSNHVVFKFRFNTLYIHLVSHIQQGTVYSLMKCVYEYTVANIIPRLAQIIWRRIDRMTSFRYLIAVMFPWMFRLGVFVWMKTLSRTRSVMLIYFAIFNVFHNRQSTRNTFLLTSTTSTLTCTRSPST